MSDNNDELIAQFMEISGEEESVARLYLTNSSWSLEEALSAFLAGHSENDNNLPKGNDNEGEASSEFQVRMSNRGAAAAEDFEKSSTSKPKFATLNDMTRRPSNEEEGQAFYAGGSERSGQQVLGPPKRKNFREQLTDMFRMANESNPSDEAPAPSTSSGVNWGQGVRLGMTDHDHAVVNPSNTDKEAGVNKKPAVILKLWSQGFSVDDGELRLYDDPENKEFLETIMRGEIPPELLKMGWMVNVDVEDHRSEDYKKPNVVKTFKGSGHTLGSPTPNVESASASSSVPAPATTTAVDPANTEKEAKEKLKVNSSEPTTTLQIRLADGSRLAAQFNLNHTVADVHQYIQNARPQYANRNFILVSSFPTRELTDRGVTIQDAGLKNAALMQRMS